MGYKLIGSRTLQHRRMAWDAVTREIESRVEKDNRGPQRVNASTPGLLGHGINLGRQRQ
jgi:hypothetical protein